MRAVSMVMHRGHSVAVVARAFGCTGQSVRSWIGRFEDEGPDSLADRPLSGRPPKADRSRVRRIIARYAGTTTKGIIMIIRDALGVKYCPNAICKILRGMGLSPQVVRRVHANRATRRQIQQWQIGTEELIARLKRAGFTAVVQDEPVFASAPAPGRKIWSSRGERPEVLYSGKHERLVVYGAISTWGERTFRMHEKFNGKAFLRYLRYLHYKYGRVAVIMDKAGQHRTKKVRRHLGENPDVRAICLPTATPELSSIEEFWRQAKIALLVSEYYESRKAAREAIAAYLRSAPPAQDVTTHIRRDLSWLGTLDRGCSFWVRRIQALAGLRYTARRPPAALRPGERRL